MKKYDENDLLDAIGEIDEKYIRESERRSVAAQVMKYSSAAAACLAFVIITGAALYSASKREDPPKPPVIVNTTANSTTVSETTIMSTDNEISDSVTVSTSIFTTTTETESETTVHTEAPTEPPRPPEPTEPESPRTEPEESTVHIETSVSATDEPTVDDTNEPVAPSESETDEPKESLPESTTPSTKPNGTFVAVTENDGNVVTDVGINQTGSIMTEEGSPADSITTSVVPESDPPAVTTPATAPVTTAPSGGGSSYNEGTNDPVPEINEYEKYYTGVAPTTGSSSQVSAHYLTKIPNVFCIPENYESTTEDKVFGSCTDIFSGSLVSLKSVEITILEVDRVYVSVLEVKLNGDILRNSGNLSENETVRILLPHGVNTTDEGLYDAKDIAGLLGEADLLEYGFGVFCVDSIGDKRHDLAGQYYKYSAIADYVLTDGMNDLILSNSYYTFFNKKTYSNLVKKLGQTPSMGDIIDYFNELKKDGHI